MRRSEILDNARRLTMTDRNKTYGEPIVNMQATADLFNGYLKSRALLGYKQEMTAEDAAVMLGLLKLARLHDRGLPYHADNYIDAVAYLSMAGEIGAQVRCARDEESVAAETPYAESS